jgi:hypothetical protein
MTAQFKKFPHIEQFKSCIKQVRDYSKWNNVPLPKLTFTGTVKLHGTNSAIGLHVPSGEQFYQSRERLIDIQSDNYGFAMWASGSADVSNLLKMIAAMYGAKEYVHVFGENAGKGVQKNVGISEFEKSFYIFAISVDDEWVELDTISKTFLGERIFFINQFPTFEIEIDFNAPELSQNQLVELTIAVENECPVSKQLGKEGTTGEGIVWACSWNGMYLMYKTKGEKHVNGHLKIIGLDVPVEIEKQVIKYMSNSTASKFNFCFLE